MKNKAPLALIEQAVMLLVFALAAVACLKVFMWADISSQNTAKQNQALVQAQNTAETLKSCGGDFSRAASIYGGTWNNSAWIVHYDSNWQQTSNTSAYLLRVVPQASGLEHLGTAFVEVLEEDTCLADLNIAWQEAKNDA